jgi:sulfatase modifying factor 1
MALPKRNVNIPLGKRRNSSRRSYGKRNRKKVNRGGSFIDFARHLRSACRSAANPLDTDENLGFRIGRNAGTKENGLFTTKVPDPPVIPEKPKILLAYFSYSGNDKKAAGEIAAMTGANLFEIERAEPYGGDIYDVSAKELWNYMTDGTVPALKNDAVNPAGYDVIILGYPTWWATLPTPVAAFLKGHDFAGKTVVTFSSNGGTQFGDSVSDLSKLIPEACVGIGYQFYYGDYKRDEIKTWLKENRIPFL